jgi:hypothetical protein
MVPNPKSIFRPILTICTPEMILRLEKKVLTIVYHSDGKSDDVIVTVLKAKNLYSILQLLHLHSVPILVGAGFAFCNS